MISFHAILPLAAIIAELMPRHYHYAFI